MSWLKVTDKKGRGWLVEALGDGASSAGKSNSLGATFCFSCLPYSAQHLYESTHDSDLVEDANSVFLNIDAAVMGLGNSSCGPGVLTKYTIAMKPYTLRLRFVPIG